MFVTCEWLGMLCLLPNKSSQAYKQRGDCPAQTGAGVVRKRVSINKERIPPQTVEGEQRVSPRWNSLSIAAKLTFIFSVSASLANSSTSSIRPPTIFWKWPISAKENTHLYILWGPFRCLTEHPTIQCLLSTNSLHSSLSSEVFWLTSGSSTRSLFSSSK